MAKGNEKTDEVKKQAPPTKEEIESIQKDLKSVFANHMSYMVARNPENENQIMASINLRHQVNLLLDMTVDKK